MKAFGLYSVPTEASGSIRRPLVGHLSGIILFTTRLEEFVLSVCLLYVKPLKTTERVMKSNGRVGAKRNIVGRSERRFILGGRNILLSEGSQAMPAHPSDKDKLKVKTLAW
jgi:hypothetical protein